MDLARFEDASGFPCTATPFVAFAPDRVHAQVVAADGDFVYAAGWSMAGGRDRVVVADASDPDAVVERGSVTLGEGALFNQAAMHEGTLYVSWLDYDGDGLGHLTAIDVSDPDAPVVLDELTTDRDLHHWSPFGADVYSDGVVLHLADPTDLSATSVEVGGLTPVRVGDEVLGYWFAGDDSWVSVADVAGEAPVEVAQLRTTASLTFGLVDTPSGVVGLGTVDRYTRGAALLAREGDDWAVAEESALDLEVMGHVFDYAALGEGVVADVEAGAEGQESWGVVALQGASVAGVWMPDGVQTSDLAVDGERVWVAAFSDAPVFLGVVGLEYGDCL